ncbi:hypothetical protein FMEAI12_1830020 [Parafrankia sp. Ea1.12]|nr:hypothetical protein FMEAI12_1830020 [Parafrankia sp. Ea1.12]
MIETALTNGPPFASAGVKQAAGGGRARRREAGSASAVGCP